MLKGVVYSIKLKLEFAILGRLVDVTGGSRSSIKSTYNANSNVVADPSLDISDVSDFVDLSKHVSNTQSTGPSRSLTGRLSKDTVPHFEKERV